MGAANNYMDYSPCNPQPCFWFCPLCKQCPLMSQDLEPLVPCSHLVFLVSFVQEYGPFVTSSLCNTKNYTFTFFFLTWQVVPCLEFTDVLPFIRFTLFKKSGKSQQWCCVLCNIRRHMVPTRLTTKDVKLHQLFYKVFTKFPHCILYMLIHKWLLLADSLL